MATGFQSRIEDLISRERERERERRSGEGAEERELGDMCMTLIGVEAAPAALH